jgi:hypothetical protein
MLRKPDDGQTLTLELLRGLAEPPGVIDELADVVAAGERADVIDGLEDAGVAVVDRGADVKLLVDPDDRGS